jgi:6-phospho-beta-glucosidase
VKVALLGGGGFRAPMVYGALADVAQELGVEEFLLQDVDGRRLARIEAVLEGLRSEQGSDLAFRTTTVLEEALDGTDFVLAAIRVGGLEGRVVDERIPLAHGVLGQETTGPAGISFALRTIPVMTEIAEILVRRAPHAWLLNFTNPAGLVTEALRDVMGDRVIGICDSPSALCGRVAAALGRHREDLWFDYFGLNHLGWLRSVSDSGGDLLPELLSDPTLLTELEEGRLFGPNFLRELGMIPNEYLYYYYHAHETSQAIGRRGETRAEFLLDQQADFYGMPNGNPSEAVARWRRARDERHLTYMEEARAAAGVQARPPASKESTFLDDQLEDPGYSGVAIEVMRAVTLNSNAVLILNVANRSSFPFLDAEAVVEVPCVVGSAGAMPLAVGEVPAHARHLFERMKEVERTTIRAAREGSAELAMLALAGHPLVPSEEVARRIFAEYRLAHPEFRAMFG